MTAKSLADFKGRFAFYPRFHDLQDFRRRAVSAFEGRAGPGTKGFAAVTATIADAPGLGVILFTLDALPDSAIGVRAMQASGMKPIA
jgi:hypothetical protein